MKTSAKLLRLRWLIVWSVVAIAFESVHGLAQEPIGSANPDDSAVRAAVTRSLPYLETAGVAWMKEQSCLSCHHVPFLLWSHQAARAKGLSVDATKLTEWETWARQDSLSRRNAYKWSKSGLDAIEKSLLPESVRVKLSQMNERVFADEPTFTASLSQHLTDEELNAYRPLLLKTFALSDYSTDRSGGGLDVLGQLLLAGSTLDEDTSSKEFRGGLHALIQRLQLPDGSWTPGNQFATMRKWPRSAADQATTMWAAIALTFGESGSSSPLEKVAAYLTQQPEHTDNTEWLATKVLYEHILGTQESRSGFRHRLLASQNPDGGWSWQVPGPSDPYTTGLALYVLARTEPLSGSRELGNARRYLVSTQAADGSWLTSAKNISNTTVPERLAARSEIYHYWGTAWSVLGLLETLPDGDLTGP